MTDDNDMHGDNTPIGTADIGHDTTSDCRPGANMAAADAYAASLTAVMFDLLTSRSRCKRLTPTGSHLADLARKLNERGFRTRTGKLFRPMTVKRLLNRMPDVVEAAKAANDEKFRAAFKHLIGVDAPTCAAEVITGMNKPPTTTGNPPTA